MILSACALLLGVLAYGLAGARLHSGSREEGGALRSVAWWSGTVLQAAGFGFTLLARHSLPLLIVQATATLGLGVTALVQHLRGVRRLGARDWLALAGLIAGLGLLAMATVPGPAAQVSASLLVLLGCLAVVGVLGLLAPVTPLLSGLLAGTCFSFGAIGARLLVGDALHPLWFFWRLPAASWLVGILTGVGIVLGQVHMTRGLARHDATPVLGPMYVLETLLPGAVGVWLMGEHPRPGFALPVVVGLLVTLACTARIVRQPAVEA